MDKLLMKKIRGDSFTMFEFRHTYMAKVKVMRPPSLWDLFREACLGKRLKVRYKDKEAEQSESTWFFHSRRLIDREVYREIQVEFDSLDLITYPTPVSFSGGKACKGDQISELIQGVDVSTVMEYLSERYGMGIEVV